MGRHRKLDQIDIFLSYARSDGGGHVGRIYHDLRQASPRFEPWFDSRVKAYEHWDRAIEDHLSTADVMIVILTRQVPERDWCRDEIVLARKKDLKIIVARFQDDVADQLGLARLEPIDFVRDPEAWRRLVAQLTEIADPARALDKAHHGAPSDDEAPVDDRHATFFRERAERERQEQRRVAEPREHGEPTVDGDEVVAAPVGTSPADAEIRLVNEMPAVAETEFFDRVDKMTVLRAALGDRNVRLVFLTGPGGRGKTAMLGELRRGLDLLPERPAGFVYLAAGGYRLVTATALLEDLGQTVGDDNARVLLGREMRERPAVRDRIDALLKALAGRPAIAVIDDVDDLVDHNGVIRDPQLREALIELARRGGHRVCVILAGRQMPSQLLRACRPHVVECDLDKGLPPGETLPFLRCLDQSNLLGFPERPNDDTDRLGVVSNGDPRFIELVVSLLRADPDLSLGDLLEDIAPRAADVNYAEATDALLRRILDRLDRTERRVVQGLAVYGRPVLPEAVDYLLHEYADGVDSVPILTMLEERRLVRRDGDRYYLPPEPDGRRIAETIPAGHKDDWKRAEPSYTRPMLRERAADYFRDCRRLSRRPIARVEDLRLHFDEIRLRIAADLYGPALELMEATDKDHLTRLGQSRALNRWRRALRGRIGNDRHEAHNLSFLVAARDESEYDGAELIRDLTRAMRGRWQLAAPKDGIRLRIQRGQVRQDDGHISSAMRDYRVGILRCRTQPMPFEEAMARIGLGLCHALVGRFTAARRQLSRADDLSKRLDGDDRDEVVALTTLNTAWVARQLDAGDDAEKILRHGLEDTAAARSLLLKGRLLDGLAGVLCDRGQHDGARDVAWDAAEIGVRTVNVTFSREANVTLAIACLAGNELPQAKAAALAATQRPAGIRALGAWATLGVVLYRLDDIVGAASAFHRACTEAWLRLEREPREFQTHDVAGLALYGLALCEEPLRLRRAVESYWRARAITTARGVRERALAQLEYFGDRVDPRMRSAVRQAANGDPAS